MLVLWWLLSVLILMNIERRFSEEVFVDCFCCWRRIPDQFSFCVFSIFRIQDGLATNSSSYLAISFLPDSFLHIKATLRGAYKKTPWKFVQFTKGICLKLKIYLSKVKNVHLFQIQICLTLLIVARLILFGLKQYYMPCYCWSQGQQLWKGKIMKMTMVVVARQFSFQPFVMCKYWESGIGQVCSSHHQLIFGFCSTGNAV